MKNRQEARELGWSWLCQLRHNRPAALPEQPKQPIADLPLPPEGATVYLRGYGWARALWTVAKDGAGEHWATNDLEMMAERRAPSWPGRLGALKTITGA